MVVAFLCDEIAKLPKILLGFVSLRCSAKDVNACSFYHFEAISRGFMRKSVASQDVNQCLPIVQCLARSVL